MTVAVLALLFGGLSGCSDDDTVSLEEAAEDTALEEAEEEGVAEQFVGQTITISGEVGRELVEGSFVIGSDFVSFGAGEGTLVYGSDVPAVSEGDFVQVTGTVTEFLVVDVEDEFGIDFGDDPLVVDYEDEFAVEASSVEVIPNELAEDDPTQLEEAEDVGLAEAVVGQTITVGGQVDSIISPEAFRIGGDETGEGTLVLSAEGTDVEVGGTVSVTGTVVEFIPEG